jgi:cysteine desulfurase
MLAAMDVVGNPSSVHAEGRAAKILVEKARAQVAELVGCLPTQVIFTSSATEAAALAVAQKARHGGVFAGLPTEHDCLEVWGDAIVPSCFDRDGTFDAGSMTLETPALIALSAANSETGVMPPERSLQQTAQGKHAIVCDITQLAGKLPIQYAGAKPAYAILSAHKFGGPKGVGAFINYTRDDPQAILRGGGQEMGRRSGTENIIGIAGFGAAAEAAAQDVTSGQWNRVAELRDILETALETSTKKTIFVGKAAPRLPNTSCIIAQGWKGETQVMQMDLSGFAISAGSACSSGKVKASKVLRAMGFDDDQAGCAIRVSLGLETTEDEVLRFADTWLAKRDKHAQRAA